MFRYRQILCFLLKFRPVADPTASEDAAVKPDKPSLGRAARPLPCLDRKCVKKPPAASTTSINTTSGGADVSGNDAATDEVGYYIDFTAPADLPPIWT